MKPNCYNCKHRGEVPGSAHSSCNSLPKEVSPVHAMVYFEYTGGKTDNISVNSHGFRNGWAFWPLDFDPVWVEHCNFYEGIK